MAQIRKRKNSYQFIVYCGEDINGKKIEKTMTYHPDPNLTPKQQEKAVLKASLEFEEKVKKGLCMDGDKVTFSEFYKKWYEEYGLIELEETTLARDHHLIKTKVLPTLGNMKLSTIKPIHLTSLYNSLRKDGVRMDGKTTGYSETTISMVHVTIKGILNKAVEWDVVVKHFCNTTT